MQTTPSIMRNSGALSKSIMKRPSPLTLSPSAANLNFTALFSASARGLKLSPHVHFPPSPSKLHATYIAHSSLSYDRAPISVSPNPLIFPGWGERVYSPSIEGFKSFSSPTPFRSFSCQVFSPVVADLTVDPRSPKLAAPQIVVSGPDSAINKENNRVRFASQGPVRPSKSLSQSLSSYPRSPFPSAPANGWPAEEDDNTMIAEETRGRQLARETPVIDGPSRARANSLQDRQLNKRNKKGLTLNRSAFAIGSSNTRKSKVVVVESSPVPAPFTPIPSPIPSSSVLGRSMLFSPSITRSNKPGPGAIGALDSLTQQFWASVSLAPSNDSAASSDSAPMVTALEYPESAAKYDGGLIMFGEADGSVYSPSLPVPGRRASKIRESLMSPAPVVLKSAAPPTMRRSVVRRDFTAPSPNDPFAAFPSFAAVLEMGGIHGGPIQYPAKVAL